MNMDIYEKLGIPKKETEKCENRSKLALAISIIGLVLVLILQLLK